MVNERERAGSAGRCRKNCHQRVGDRWDISADERQIKRAAELSGAVHIEPVYVVEPGAAEIDIDPAADGLLEVIDIGLTGDAAGDFEDSFVLNEHTDVRSVSKIELAAGKIDQCAASAECGAGRHGRAVDVQTEVVVQHRVAGRLEKSDGGDHQR